MEEYFLSCKGFSLVRTIENTIGQLELYCTGSVVHTPTCTTGSLISKIIGRLVLDIIHFHHMTSSLLSAEKISLGEPKRAWQCCGNFISNLNTQTSRWRSFNIILSDYPFYPQAMWNCLTLTYPLKRYHVWGFVTCSHSLIYHRASFLHTTCLVLQTLRILLKLAERNGKAEKFLKNMSLPLFGS